ncbi:hypothetical protein CAMSH0001_0786 [Campylobacter showae RM3277]|uniref:Uncharacterized protein n=1 Tax=Campylobacter showae RM3277 TaxID=553219 RepID=C6RHF8_9BACT|nr:hypothetical protein CAMSH0001_0786 [Campylobacter showae RM3277]
MRTARQIGEISNLPILSIPNFKNFRPSKFSQTQIRLKIIALPV